MTTESIKRAIGSWFQASGLTEDQALLHLSQAVNPSIKKTILHGHGVTPKSFFMAIRPGAGNRSTRVAALSAAEQGEHDRLMDLALRGKADPAEQDRLVALMDRTEAARVRGAA